MKFFKVLMYKIRERARFYISRANRKKNTVIEPPAELLVYAFDIAKTQIDHYIKPIGAQWLRKDFNKNAFDNMNFIYKNTVFSVIIDIQDKNGVSYLPVRIKKNQEKAAKKNNLIPCKFLITVDNPYIPDISQIKIKNPGLNLIHTTTNKVILLDDYATNRKQEYSKWELHNFAIKYAVLYLQGNGYKINSFQDNLELDPQIWFSDKNGKTSWVIVRYDVNTTTVKMPKNIDDISRKGFSNNGYFFGAIIKSPNQKSKKLYRGENIDISISTFENIHTSISMENVKRVSILEENIYNLVLRSVSQKVLYSSEELAVYPVFNHDDLLLKIGYDYLHHLDTLKDNLTLVPIQYEGNVRNNKNLGLTLYHITTKDSKYAKDGFVVPKDVVTLLRTENFNLIRKIEGQDASSFYLGAFQQVIGAKKIDYKNYPRYTQFKTITDIYKKYGNDAVVAVLSLCEQGITKIEANLLAENSPEYKLLDGQNFAKDYNKFLELYLGTIAKISGLPQTTFDKAIKDILYPKEFIFDFVHPRNIFIDFEKQELNFIDFVFEENVVKKTQNVNYIRMFRNALLGRHFSMELHPKDLMYYPKARELFEHYAKIITDKINVAAPEEYKLTTNY